ncbi:MAG: FtsX-like permease family protein [Bacteroidetes bacterium]|nr:FtsX-like permease family protein [Bacteroidota bacterium]
MNFTRLVIRDFFYYRKAFLAILCGAIISSAVLTGALVLGDSVKYSLERLAADRLGKIRYALHPGGRYFRQALADEIRCKTGGITAPAMLSEGIAVNPENNTRINRVQLVGIDGRFTKFWENTPSPPDDGSAVISRNTAEKLGLKAGGIIILRISKGSLAPANAPFVAEKNPVLGIRFLVSAVAGDEKMGLFSLNNNQEAPFTVFISLDKMAGIMGLKGKANLLLMGPAEKPGDYKPDSLLRMVWQPEDAGMDFHPFGLTGKFELTSGRIFIDDSIAAAVRSVLPRGSCLMTYLVNSFRFEGQSTPYSFVTAASPDFIGMDPGKNGIIINSWLASDLKIKEGDSLRLRYFTMGPRRSLSEDSSVFVVLRISPMQDPIWDPSLMPDFPGMSEAGNCRDWETGAPVDLKKIRQKDEDYWNSYRGTPKAFISLATGQKLWSNPFGNLTSIRFEAGVKELNTLTPSIIKKLNPAQQGLAFKPVYLEGINAASDSTDFAGLFLSLSFFIILAALLLVSLLFSLHIRSRTKESGVLSAIGFRKQQIFRVLLYESLVLSIAGGISGAFTGILYNRLMLYGLNTIWQDAVGTSGLQMKINALTLVLGALAGTFTALPFMLTVLWKNLRRPAWLQVSAIQSDSLISHRRELILSRAMAIFLVSGSIAYTFFLLFYLKTTSSSLFLVTAALMLAGGAFAMYSFLISRSGFKHEPASGILALSFKNASLAKNRSITVIILLALGTFSIFITAANRKTFYGLENDVHSGTGGFRYWAGTGIPLRYDPGSMMGRKEYAIGDESCLKNAGITAIQKFEGDDASCLNLNKAQVPSVLAIPPEVFNRKGSFSFLSLDKGIDENHPWLALRKPLGPDVIPAFADQTVITWGLHKKPGDTLFYTGENGKKTGLKIMGGLDNSVFQGYVLISDSLFRLHFSSVTGYKIFLIDSPLSEGDSITKTLETVFRDYGMNTMPASEKLASFNAVENTYLAVFMLLGTLGVILGTVGLGVVLISNMIGRKQELALYIALGFSRNYILKLVMAEHLMILLAGTCLGMVSALCGILPSMLSPACQAPGLLSLLPIPVFLLNGILWVWLPAKAVMTSLRKEGLSKGLAI